MVKPVIGNRSAAYRVPLEGEPDNVRVPVCANTLYKEIQKLTKREARTTIRGRPYHCSHGHSMILVCLPSCPHFRHKCEPVTKSSDEATVAADNDDNHTTRGCSCDDTHVLAQSKIKAEPQCVDIQTWRACGKHVADKWSAPGDATAVLEESAVYNGIRRRYDVVIRNRDGKVIKVIEVRNKHATRPEDRPPDTAEIGASEIITMYENRRPNGGRVVLHNQFSKPGKCPECEHVRFLKAERKQRELQEEMARKERERQREAEAEEQRQIAQRELQKRQAEEQKRRTAAEAKRLSEAQANRRLRIEDEMRIRAEQDDVFTKLKLKSDAYQHARAQDAMRYELQATPSFSVSGKGCGNMPDLTHDEIEAIRKERMDRQKVERDAKKARQRRRR